MARPKTLIEPRQMGVVVPGKVIDAMRDLAAAAGHTFSAEVRDALAAHVARANKTGVRDRA